MNAISKLITLNVDHNINKPEGVFASRFAIETGYSKVTGIAVINTGTHKKFDFGLNDHNNNTRLDLVDISFWSPNQMAADKLIPVDIPVSGNFLQVLTSVRTSLPSKIGYQVIAKIEK